MKSMIIVAIAAILSFSSTLTFAANNFKDSVVETEDTEVLAVIEVLNENDPGLTDEQLAILERDGAVAVAKEQYASRNGRAHRHGTGVAFAARIAVIRRAVTRLSVGSKFSGLASFYGNDAGNKTASGQRFNENAMTAAHLTLAFGTKLRVTCPRGSVVVTVNDRGPYIQGRVLDLSKGAARACGLTSQGVGRVTAEVI